MENEGIGRFAGSAIKGGIIGGILCSIPLLNILNCCFCLLNLVGVFLGLSFHLKSDADFRMSNGDAAISGAISGAIAGAITAVLGSILGFIFNLIAGGMIASMMAMAGDDLAPILGQLGGNTAGGIMGLFINMGTGFCVGIPIYAAMGAIGALIALNLAFKEQIAS